MATTLGEQHYEFKGGYPAPETTQKARDDAEYQRAVTAYRFWYPTVPCEGILSGMRDSGMRDNQDIQILACGPRHGRGVSDAPPRIPDSVTDVRKRQGPLRVDRATSIL